MRGSTSRRSICLPGLAVRLVLVSVFLMGTRGEAYGGEIASFQIKVDQVGYRPDAAKLAVVTEEAKTFEVKRASDNVTVFRGTREPASLDADTGDSVQIADFSKLDEVGAYYLDVPGVGRSWTFLVRQDVFLHTYYLAMRAFYGQRCGTAVDLEPEFPGFTHAACHLKGEFHSSSGKQGERDNIGGWHDAGDYGRYVVNSGMTTGTLLWTWEIYGPKVKSTKLNIPESGNGTPDILNETRWNLEWMLHYLLGRNTFSLSWVTQVGANPCRHPHHRPSAADKSAEPWPGLLSGGPNTGRQDDALKKLPQGLPPAKIYVDDQGSYASNEIAINWQAALVFLLGVLA